LTVYELTVDQSTDCRKAATELFKWYENHVK